jgi:PAS domain S-box-containing protein
MERITGIPAGEALGRSVLEVLPQMRPELYARIMRALAGDVVRLDHYAYRVPATGRTGVCEAILSPIVEDGEVVGVVSSVRDITERKEFENQLWHAQRMETVGRLAGGIAHDFNNLLTVIRGFGELLVQRLDNDPVGLRSAGEITKATEQAALLVRQLLSFARRDLVEPQELDLNALVSDAEAPGATILLVEDAPSVRTVTRAILEARATACSKPPTAPAPSRSSETPAAASTSSCPSS